jgi:hypothetical protein
MAAEALRKTFLGHGFEKQSILSSEGEYTFVSFLKCKLIEKREEFFPYFQ